MIILSIGGNLGNVEATFARALDALQAGGFSVSRVSSPYRNPAVGCEEDAPDFTNWAVVGEWAGTPSELLDLAQSIEVAAGRPADHPHWRSRTLDIDLIACNGLVCDTPRLTLPHPRWQERDFVLVPLREVAPEWLAENLPSKGRNNGSQKCS